MSLFKNKEKKSKQKSEAITMREYRPAHKLTMGASSHIGMRDYQQDAFYISDTNSIDENKGCIAIMCDGMGGMECGEEASHTCVAQLVNDFNSQEKIEDIPKFLNNEIDVLDYKVSCLSNYRGENANAGTTLISVIIKDNKLFWVSVGDSRIYIYRENELVQLTRDHNYMLELMAKVKEGLITLEQASKDPQKNALISYIGIGKVEIVDISYQEFPLKQDDIILLCSDGLYGTLTETEIIDVIKATSMDMQLLSHRLVIESFDKGMTHQDNVTAVVIKFI